MKKILLLSFVVFGLNSFAQNEGNYQLIIDGKANDLDVDETIVYTTPNGETVEITLKQKDILAYSDEFVSFNYPKQYQPAKSDLGHGVNQIALISNLGSGFMLQEYSTMNPESLNRMMLNEITKESIGYGYKMKEEEFSHKCKSGEVLKGIKATLTYKDDVQEYVIASYGKKDSGVLIATMINDEFRKQDSIILETFFDSIFLRF